MVDVQSQEDQKKNFQGGYLHPVPSPKTPEELAKGEDTVTMIFPKDILFTDKDHSRIPFKAGVREVPKRLADNWYLLMNGAKVYDSSTQLAKIDESHVRLLNHRGLAVTSINEVITYFNKLTKMEQDGFLLAAKGLAPQARRADAVDVKFLQSRGYKADSVEFAQKFIDNIEEKNRPGYESERFEFSRGMTAELTLTDADKSSEPGKGPTPEPLPEAKVEPGKGPTPVPETPADSAPDPGKGPTPEPPPEARKKK